MVTIDVNSERCIYVDDADREFIITTGKGHSFSNEPFKIIISKKEVVVNLAGLVSHYPPGGQWEAGVSTNFSLSRDGTPLCLDEFGFKAVIPSSSDLLDYRWSYNFDSHCSVFPSMTR